MTEIPSSPGTLPPESIPARRPRISVAGWLLVALMTAAIFAMQGFNPGFVGQVDPETYPSPLLKYYGRISLAIDTMAAGDSPLADAVRPTLAQLEPQIDMVSENAIDQLRAIPLLAEIGGAESVLARITDLGSYAENELFLQEQDREADEEQVDVEEEPSSAVDLAPMPERDPYVYEEMAEDLAALRTIYADQGGVLDEDAREGLMDRHGWFAQMALSHGAPDDDPNRLTIRKNAQFALAFLMAAFAIGILAFAAGFVLFILAIVFGATGKLKIRLALPRALASTSIDGATLIETMGLFLASFIVVGMLAGIAEEATGIALTVPMMWLTLLVVMWPVVRGERWSDVRNAIGWNTGAGFFRELGAGFVGYLAGLPIVLVGIGVTITLIQASDMQPSHPAQNMLSGGFWGTVALYSLACVWAPVVEETMFRGAFFGGIRARTGRFFEGALISSFVFAAIHPQGVVAIPALMSLAIVFCCLREWRGSIIAPALAHSVNNAFLITIMLVLMG